MSSSAMSLAMIPVKQGIRPIVHIDQGGLISYRDRYQTQDGIVFRGYVPTDQETTAYGRSGRPRKNDQATGEIVDLYI